MTKLTMKNVLALGLAGAVTLGAASPTMALPLGSIGEAVKQAAPDAAITDVHWRGHGRGWGWGIGLGAFALGAAVASGYPYGYGPYSYGPAYGYYDPYYYGGHCWRRWGRVYCNY